MFQIITLFCASEVTPWGSPSQEDSERTRSTALLWGAGGGHTKWLWERRNPLKLLSKWFNHLLFSREIIEKIHMEVKDLEIDSLLMSSNLLKSPLVTPVWKCCRCCLKVIPEQREVSQSFWHRRSTFLSPHLVYLQRPVSVLIAPGIPTLSTSRSRPTNSLSSTPKAPRCPHVFQGSI